MQDLRIYGISLGGITFSIMPDINPLLQTVVLLLTIVYTLIGIKNKLNNSCWRMWSSSVVTVNGELVPCCFDKDAKYQLGNLNHDSFDVIWRNKAYNRFRLNILNNRQGIDICKNCSEGSKVWA